MELQFSLTPGDTVIAVGQSFVAQLALGGGCTPLHPVAATWRTLDTAVAFVDATAGRVTGRAVGDARIIAASSSGDFPTTVHVR
jgi:hypothetical protein